jgi:hypothetical protein
MRLAETIERPRDAVADRVRGPRRKAKVAAKATRAVYRTGHGAGRLSARSAQPLPPPLAGAAFLAGAATGVATGYLLGHRGGHDDSESGEARPETTTERKAAEAERSDGGSRDKEELTAKAERAAAAARR